MDLGHHLRRTFLAGLFAAIPLVVTAIAIYYVDKYTGILAPKVFGRSIPLLGLVIAVLGIYLLGLLVTTALAKWFLTRLDSLLERLPILRPVYRAWKQVSLNQGNASMWDKVALVEVETGQTATLGFTTGVPLAEAPEALCVYVPSAPAPTTGRLYFVPLHRCRIIEEITPEEAFKHILSGGNYVPPGLGKAWRELAADPR